MDHEVEVAPLIRILYYIVLSQMCKSAIDKCIVGLVILLVCVCVCVCAYQSGTVVGLHSDNDGVSPDSNVCP